MTNVYTCAKCNRVIQLWINDTKSPYNETEGISKNCKAYSWGGTWMSENEGTCNA